PNRANVITSLGNGMVEGALPPGLRSQATLKGENSVSLYSSLVHRFSGQSSRLLFFPHLV
ncbi:hypothetical protein QQP08_017813, partial [Theobroma cacao]